MRQMSPGLSSFWVAGFQTRSTVSHLCDQLSDIGLCYGICEGMMQIHLEPLCASVQRFALLFGPVAVFRHLGDEVT